MVCVQQIGLCVALCSAWLVNLVPVYKRMLVLDRCFHCHTLIVLLMNKPKPYYTCTHYRNSRHSITDATEIRRETEG